MAFAIRVERSAVSAALFGLVLGFLTCAASADLRGQDIEIAEELVVDLSATDPTAGTEIWESQGTIINFIEVGDPIIVDREGVPAVDFNSGATFDAYESEELAPAGLVGVDATRTVEVWTYNPDIASEETLVSWGHRGGPNGTNVSFNYGNHVLFSAIGHWGGEFPDIGWGPVPPASQWHHLVYTYDGATTRVYQDGFISNAEYLGPGVINTFDTNKIALAAQYANAVALDQTAIRGVLSLGKVRIHDGVLAPEQILKNYFIERPDFPLPAEVPVLLNAPVDNEDWLYTGATEYRFQLKTGGFPLPDFSVSSPAGATVSKEGLITYVLPKPEPASFTVTVTADNPNGPTGASWTVTILKGTAVVSAGELFVDVDARDPTAGTPSWSNAGSVGAFIEVGDPTVVTVQGAPGVSFNQAAAQDAYQSENIAPEGLVGLDPTRSIEAWVLNPSLQDEEGVVSWGNRGGPDGTNMSLNCGAHQWFGAVTHWGGSHADLGWTPNLPPAGRWNHLAYTYDGANTRVYLNGVEAAWEGLGPNQINTFGLSKITLGAQVGVDLLPDFVSNTHGSLIIGRVRVHDGTLTAAQVYNNYQAERGLFPQPPSPSFTMTPPQGVDPLQVTVDAGASTSPNGAITTYEWDFGDGETGTGVKVNHTFARAGRYVIKLTITDDKGASESLTQSYIVDFRSESVSPWISAGVEDTPPLLEGGARPAAGGCLEVYAGGRGVAARADQFHFVYQELTGEASVTARVQAGELPANARLGVMLREDLTAGSKHASMFIQNFGAGRYSFVRREAANGLTRAPKNSTESFTLPNAWVRIQRTGGDLIGLWSTDGNTWTELGRQAIAMPDKVLGGIAAMADDTQGAYLTARATLCDLAVVGGAPVGGGFRRGDADGNGALELTDAVFVLNHQFLGGPTPACFDAADVDDSGIYDLTDAVFSLGFQFLGGPAPPAPGPATCGPDGSADDFPPCVYPGC